MALRVFDIDDVNQTYTLKFGNFELNELVTVPKGYILNQTEDTKTIIKMGPNGAIEVNGPVNMLGELKIFGSDPNDSGSLFINADGKSVRIHDLSLKNVTNFSRRPYPLTGAFTVNNSSNIKINYLRMDSVKCEDGLNIVNSNFIVDFAEFNETYSDAIDVDFGNGVFQNILMDNIGYAGGEMA